MKLINTFLTSLTITLGVFAQNDSTAPKNQGTGALNLTEATAVYRSLTFYPLDGKEEKELCGDSSVTPVGKQYILKEHCQELIDFMKTAPGYWEVNGYTKASDMADLVIRGSCEFTVFRQDGLNTHFEIGNMDVISFVEAAMRATEHPTRMATGSGSVTCAGDSTPLVAWKAGYPLAGALPSAHISAIGWVLVGMSMSTFTFM